MGVFYVISTVLLLVALVNQIVGLICSMRKVENDKQIINNTLTLVLLCISFACNMLYTFEAILKGTYTIVNVIGVIAHIIWIVVSIFSLCKRIDIKIESKKK